MLDTLDHVASIVTAIIAGFAYGQYQLRRWRKRKRLEEYLRDLRSGQSAKSDKGQRTVLHLVAALGMTEADILDAAFSSSRINRSTAQDRDTGRAAAILFHYSN